MGNKSEEIPQLKYYPVEDAGKLKEGQLAICRCLGWSEQQYWIARWEDGIFQYDNQPNPTFNRYVTDFMPLNEYGKPHLLK